MLQFALCLALFSCLLQYICVPFMLTNPMSVDISLTAYNATFQSPWVGKVEPADAGKWIDDFMVLVSNQTIIVSILQKAEFNHYSPDCPAGQYIIIY